MTKRTITYAFRMTHIDNIPHIVKCGIVKSSSPMADANYKPIGDGIVISKRQKRVINGVALSDYIPFYLGCRTPMLYVIQNGYNGVQKVAPTDIVYCVLRIDDIREEKLTCIFTDGHALDKNTNIYTQDRLDEINELVDAEALNLRYWNEEETGEAKRRKEAELLIAEDIAPRMIKGFVVYDEQAKNKMLSFGIEDAMIAVRPSFYF